MPRVKAGDNLTKMVLDSLAANGIELLDTDVVVVTQKVVSKAEGRILRVEDIKPGRKAKELGRRLRKDPRTVQVVLQESRRIVRRGHGVLITETHHGFICANAGIDQSNVEEGYITLLPVDPDASARRIRGQLERRTGKKLAVVITDTFGRPWREGQIDVAIGCSGIKPLDDLVGTTDPYGHLLRVTQPAIVDEVASAAELVMSKHSLTPVSVVRGLRYRRGDLGVKQMIRPWRYDLFR